jgi:hypothetical protein
VQVKLTVVPRLGFWLPLVLMDENKRPVFSVNRRSRSLVEEILPSYCLFSNDGEVAAELSFVSSTNPIGLDYVGTYRLVLFGVEGEPAGGIATVSAPIYKPPVISFELGDDRFAMKYLEGRIIGTTQIILHNDLPVGRVKNKWPFLKYVATLDDEKYIRPFAMLLLVSHAYEFMSRKNRWG